MIVTGWRTVQFFIGKDGVSEVALEQKTMRSRCTCDTWAAQNKCKHTAFVNARVKNNGGTYMVAVGRTVAHAEVLKALEKPDTMRELLLKHGKIEVL